MPIVRKLADRFGITTDEQGNIKILPDLQLLNSLQILTKSDMDEGTLII
jgi:hypothetical protein